MIVDPKFARFAAELGEAYDALLDKHADNLSPHFPLELTIHTVDGVAARYMEEGIDFYPTNK